MTNDDRHELRMELRNAVRAQVGLWRAAWHVADITGHDIDAILETIREFSVDGSPDQDVSDADLELFLQRFLPPFPGQAAKLNKLG